MLTLHQDGDDVYCGDKERVFAFKSSLSKTRRDNNVYDKI